MLSRRKKYLQIALNSSLDEAEKIIEQIPLDERILIEAGTPLIKEYGTEAISSLRMWWEQKAQRMLLERKRRPRGLSFWDILKEMRANTQEYSLGSKLLIRGYQEISRRENSFSPYIVADLKCIDRGAREVYIAYEEGAQAATVLGSAPVETINAFIKKCEELGLDSMIDMMNIPSPLIILRQLKKPPRVVILHRGVDEENFNPEKQIPYHHIQQIKGNYNNVLVSIAGGDTIREVQRSIFNDADIVVVWKEFYQSTANIGELAREFLKEIR